MTDEPKTRSGAPIPDFAAFYRALNGRDPFPWQERLARQVEENEAWPGEIGVPTGLGKTSCLDIAVWWLASQAHRRAADRTAPTRIWWVVNRRLLVDSTAEHAERMKQALSEPEGVTGLSAAGVATVAGVADRLRSLSSVAAADPLEVIRLRGGVETRTPSDPSRPAVVLCTLPMFGSRLLFRGYGSSTKMRPIDAAMAGTDSLVLLDEAHLAPHLRSLLEACFECAPGVQPILGARSRPQVAALTATGDASAPSRFDLDERDYAHPVVRQRVGASKPIEVRNMESGEVSRNLAEATKELLDGAPAPASALVFANTPSTARDTHRKLGRLLDPDIAEVLLLTGRSRERESEVIRERILDDTEGMAAGREAGAGRRRHLVVVATQTLEVGADIDAEYLVTDACGVRALTQRLGRLNRLGNFRHARGIYLHSPPRPLRKGSSEEPMWLVYGQEPRVVIERLKAAAGGETVELCPARVNEVLGKPQDDPGRAPELLFGILWEWMKTTTPPSGEAPVEPFFSGIRRGDSSVSVIWRAHLPKAKPSDTTEGAAYLWPRARDREAVDVPIPELREFLGTDEVLRLAHDRLAVEFASWGRLRPGDTVILASDRGGLDEFGWNPAVSKGNMVMDVSLSDRGLPLDSGAIERLCGVRGLGERIETALGSRGGEEEVPDNVRREAMEQILEKIRGAQTPNGWTQPEWKKFVTSLGGQPVEPRWEVARIRSQMADPEPRSDELDEMSLVSPTGEVVDLESHGRDVGERARAIADRLGLDATLAATVETAGCLHDIGKADRRFQRWLDPDGDHPEDLVLAKSDMPRHRWDAARAAARWPRGGRHEALSARLVRHWLDSQPLWGDPLQRELLLHLVISHHGKGRPLVPPVKDDTASLVSWTVEGRAVEAPANLSEVDWGQPRRFRSLNGQFGPWGLALLESIVRLADHAVSGRARKERR